MHIVTNKYSTVGGQKEKKKKKKTVIEKQFENEVTNLKGFTSVTHLAVLGIARLIDFFSG